MQSAYKIDWKHTSQIPKNRLNFQKFNNEYLILLTENPRFIWF